MQRLIGFTLFAILAIACSTLLWAPGGAQGSPVTIPAAVATVMASPTTLIVKAGGGVYYGVVNVAPTAQTQPIICYDNAGATSGPVLVDQTLGANAAAAGVPAGGVGFRNGLTCAIGTAVSAPGVAIYAR